MFAQMTKEFRAMNFQARVGQTVDLGSPQELPSGYGSYSLCGSALQNRFNFYEDRLDPLLEAAGGWKTVGAKSEAQDVLRPYLQIVSQGLFHGLGQRAVFL